MKKQLNLKEPIKVRTKKLVNGCQSIYLDIYMNGSNGIDTAKELRRSDTDCLLVFTTTSTDQH